MAGCGNHVCDLCIFDESLAFMTPTILSLNLSLLGSPFVSSVTR